MRRTGRAAAWFCILGFALMSCYTSKTIYGPGSKRGDKKYLEDINRLVTYEGAEYAFDARVSLLGDSVILGTCDGTGVSVPLSDIRAVYLDEMDVGKTLQLGVLVAVVSAGIIALVVAVGNEPVGGWR